MNRSHLHLVTQQTCLVLSFSSSFDVLFSVFSASGSGLLVCGFSGLFFGLVSVVVLSFWSLGRPCPLSTSYSGTVYKPLYLALWLFLDMATFGSVCESLMRAQIISKLQDLWPLCSCSLSDFVSCSVILSSGDSLCNI